MPICGFPYAEVSEEALSFAALEGFAEEDHEAAFRTFALSCQAIVEKSPSLRPALEPPQALTAVCRKALTEPPKDAAAARRFFETYFKPYRVSPGAASGSGFVTGYYEPVVEGSLTQDANFSVPVFGRPADLVTLNQGESIEGPEGRHQAARKGPRGLEPYPDRAAIEAGALGDQARPIVWLKDKVEVFFVQVQGSARVRLTDGSERRLIYAGRNGHSYRSIGRILIEEHNIAPQQADMEGLKQWIRAQGQGPGEAGAALMSRNKSYVFFSVAEAKGTASGPIGGQGLPLTPFRSIALDRAIWPYGLPMWIETEIPWRAPVPTPFRRLMIGQDTGSAMTGAARGDLFFGSGDAAGLRAGTIAHSATFTVLLPQPGEPS